MSRVAITVEGLGKEYQLGGQERRHETFYEMLTALLRAPLQRWQRLSGKDRQQRRFWALRDLNLEVRQGEVLGIVGRNGAGKSTLLKVLSRITAPTQGKVTIRGRVASLLEVGTGFHPELSGRENIYLNGAILGMARQEINRQFDSIVAFAEIERFLDTPVKRYSSGMYVRLAFAVAAHLDPDVLLVDEVLAVGDQEFRQRCLGKMRDVAGQGRTVLFVSHDMAAIQRLCSTAIWVGAGQVQAHGDVDEVVQRYLLDLKSGKDFATASFRGPLCDRVRFERVVCETEAGVEKTVFGPDERIRVRIEGWAERSLSAMDITLGVYSNGVRLASLHDAPPSTDLACGEFASIYRIAPGVLRPGLYQLAVGGRRWNGEWVWGEEIAGFELTPYRGETRRDRDLGLVNLDYDSERHGV